jgi:hypothetical protein
MSKIAICFLTKVANNETFQFAESLCQPNYDIYICIDDNNCKFPSFDCEKIKIIRFYDNESELNGFKGSVVYCIDRACSRDKALYYFCKLNNTYDYIWFLEEDVFIPNKNTIMNLDSKYNNDDLLSAQHIMKKSYTDNENYWQHWFRLNNKIEFPWAHSMISAVRVSKLLLSYICEFATQNKFLLFDEALFNTIAQHKNLTITNPIELSNIIFHFYDLNLTRDDVNETYLYHPIKNLNRHILLRK